MLNAKRHQRLGQQLKALRRLACRLVLNAKRHQRLGQTLSFLPPALSSRRAQRLTASKVGTAGDRTRPHSRVECSTPKGIKGWDRASSSCCSCSKHCAQRQKASKVGTVSECKTSPLCQWPVLNAKRHQRLGQSLKIEVLLKLLFVLNAKRHQRLGQSAPAATFRQDLSAQRQKASKVGTACTT